MIHDKHFLIKKYNIGLLLGDFSIVITKEAFLFYGFGRLSVVCIMLPKETRAITSKSYFIFYYSYHANC